MRSKVDCAVVSDPLTSQRWVLPASTGSETDVMYRASSEARNRHALATSTASTHGIGKHVHRTRRLGELLAGDVLEVWPERPADMVVLDHRCVHVGRMHRVDPDIVRGKLIGQAAHQSDDTVFGGGVVRHPDQPPQARDGADQNHRPGSAFDEVRSRGATGPPDPGQVDIQHCLPGDLGEFHGHAA